MADQPYLPLTVKMGPGPWRSLTTVASSFILASANSMKFELTTGAVPRIPKAS